MKIELTQSEVFAQIVNGEEGKSKTAFEMISTAIELSKDGYADSNIIANELMGALEAFAVLN